MRHAAAVQAHQVGGLRPCPLLPASTLALTPHSMAGNNTPPLPPRSRACHALPAPPTCPKHDHSPPTLSHPPLLALPMCSEPLAKKKAVVEELIDVLALSTCRHVKIGRCARRGLQLLFWRRV